MEATSWLFYKRGRGFQLGTTENKSSKSPERDLNPGPLSHASSFLILIATAQLC